MRARFLRAAQLAGHKRMKCNKNRYPPLLNGSQGVLNLPISADPGSPVTCSVQLMKRCVQFKPGGVGAPRQCAPVCAVRSAGSHGCSCYAHVHATTWHSQGCRVLLHRPAHASTSRNAFSYDLVGTQGDRRGIISTCSHAVTTTWKRTRGTLRRAELAEQASAAFGRANATCALRALGMACAVDPQHLRV